MNSPDAVNPIPFWLYKDNRTPPPLLFIIWYTSGDFHWEGYSKPNLLPGLFFHPFK